MFTKSAIISFFITVSIILPFVYYHYDYTYKTTRQIEQMNMKRVITHVLSKNKTKLNNTDWASQTVFCLDKDFQLELFVNNENICFNDFMKGINKIIFRRNQEISVYLSEDGQLSNTPAFTIPINLN